MRWPIQKYIYIICINLGEKDRFEQLLLKMKLFSSQLKGGKETRWPQKRPNSASCQISASGTSQLSDTGMFAGSLSQPVVNLSHLSYVFNHWLQCPTELDLSKMKNYLLIFTEEKKLKTQELQTYEWSHYRIPIFLYI